MSPKRPCPMLAKVEAHFQGRLRPPGERRMRAHLVHCPICRASYDRRLVLTRIDPEALDRETRLARGLGLPLGARGFWLARRGTIARASVLVGAAAAAALLLARPAPRHLPTSGDEAAEFAARGPDAAHASSAPRVHLYRFAAANGSARAVRVDGVITPEDELAVAYENPSGPVRYLLVFGVDEHRHVYWYHPAWTRASENPIAIAIEAGTDRVVELPRAVRHELDGARLTVYAIFSAQPLAVRQIEELVARTSPGAGLPLPSEARAHQQQIELVVQPREGK